MRKLSILAVGFAFALSFSACSSQHSTLPNIATESVPSGTNSPQMLRGGGMHPDDPCAGGNDTICIVGGGSSGNVGSTFGGGGGGGYGGGVLCPQAVKGGSRRAFCSAGGGGGTGTGGCLTNPDNCVGVLSAAPGVHCHDSISGIDENVPTSTSDWAHQVRQIDTVSATTTDLVNGGTATGPMGYIYEDNNGEWYLGESPSYTGNAWQVMANQFGFIGQLLTGVHEYGKNFDEKVTATQVQQMKGYHAGQNISVVPCVVPKSSVS